MDLQAFGQMLRAEREKRGWDQAELARHIDVRQQTVSRWEAGTSRPKRSVVTTLASLFGAEEVQQWLDAAGYPDPTVDTPDELNRPVRPLLTVLPLDRLSSEAFEQFCRDLVADVYPGGVVHRFGGQGHKQDGIDLYAELPDGHIHTYQCKRHRQFGPEMVHQAVAETGIVGDRHHLLLSRVATPAARKAIAEYPDWRLWDVEDISRALRRDLEPDAARQLVETYFPGWSGDFLGLPEPGPWVTADNFFRPYESRARTFSHAWTLVGRSPDLQWLLEFTSAPDRQVAVLAGRGGSGKSRLLKALAVELAGRSPTTAIRFLLPGIPIKLSDIEQLPRAAQLLIIVDDAHDTDDLPVLLNGMSYHRPNAKILLATRPYGTALIQAAVARAGLIEPVLHHLEDLARDDVEALATEILVNEERDPALASRVAEVTRDSPLMTVVGASLVAKNLLDPHLLANQRGFRRELLARFHDVIVGGWADPAERALLRNALQFVALLQPVRDVDGDFRAAAAAVIGAPFDAISRQLRALEDAGVLLRRGGRLRVVPDLLGDYIVADACFAESSRQPTGYADRVFHEVHGESARHLLVNLSKLDWRMTTENNVQTSLLDRIWAIITERFRSAGIFQRAHILKELAQVAYYQPRRALDLVLLALEEPTDHVDEPYDLLFPETQTTYVEVERELAPILRNVAYNFDHLFEACNLLWKLAQRDESDRNTSFESPIKVLQDLASLDRRKPLAYSERVVDCALQWLSQPQPADQTSSPFDVLDQALATEGTESTTKGSMVTLRSYYFKADALRALRHRVIDAAFDTLLGHDLLQALRAANTIKAALRYPIGRNCGEDVRDQWTAEFLPILKRLEDAVTANPLDPVLLYQIRRAIGWHTTRAKGRTRPEAQAVLNAMPDTVEHRLTRALIDPWEWSFSHSTDVEESARRSKQWLNELRAELTTRYGTHDLTLLLEERLTVLAAVRRHGDSLPGVFTGELVTASKDLGVAVIGRIIARPDSSLREILDAALAATASVDAEDAIRLARRLLSFDDVDLHRRVASAYGRGLGHRTNLIPSEIGLVKELAVHHDAHVRQQIVYAIDSLAATDPDGALTVLAGMDFGQSTRLADETLSMFSSHHVFDVQDLMPRQMNLILDRLRTLPSLDGHWIGEFLGALSPAAPQQVLALLMDRISLAGDHSRADYRPIPYGWDERSPLRFRETDAFEVILRNIRNWAAGAADAPEQHYWSPILFAAAASGFDGPVLDILNEWITSPRREQVETVSNLVREAPSEFLFDHSDFTIRLLDAAWRHGRKTYERVARALYNSATSGMRAGTFGEPFPQDVAQRHNAQALASQLPAGSPAHQFFRDFAQSMEQRIRREMEQDEEMT